MPAEIAHGKRGLGAIALIALAMATLASCESWHDDPGAMAAGTFQNWCRLQPNCTANDLADRMGGHR